MTEMPSEFKSYSWVVHHYAENIIKIDSVRLSTIDPYFSGYVEDPENEGNPLDIYEYYITDVNDYLAEEMMECFEGVYLEYSDAFGRWILLVPHIGTDWKFVYVEMTEKGKSRYMKGEY